MRARSTYTWHLAPKTAFIPLRAIVSDDGELGREYPPFTGKRQIAALHFCQRDVLTAADFSNMLIEPGAQGSGAFRFPFRRLADVDEHTLEVEGIDSATGRPDAFFKLEQCV